MTEVEDLFNDAYRLSVVEEKHRQAIELCRRALMIEPDNYRVLVFLGMLLGDHGIGQEIVESRQCFITAIEKATSASCFCTTWPEEAAIHHLGVWERSQGHHLNACLFFLLDTMLCRNKESQRGLMEYLSESDIGMLEDLKLIRDRLEAEYQVVLKAKGN